MTAKYYLKVAALAALALVSSVSTAGAQEKPQAKQKNQPLLSSVQVPPSEKGPAKLQAAAKVSAEQVKAAAIEKHKGWPVKYVMIKNLKGNLVYEVEFTDDQEYWFDAGTGDLVGSN